MNTNKNIVAQFEDKYGETRLIHTTRHGLTVKRQTGTPCQILGTAISSFVGKRIREIRISRGLTAEELAIMAGLTFSNHPKARMYAIEKNTRNCGMRFGTLYQIALALEVEVSEILPNLSEIRELVKIDSETTSKLRVSP